MKFKIKTLIDITETGEHHGVDTKKTNQQANYNSVIQTLGIRANVIPGKVSKTFVKVEEFGTDFYGVHNCWEFDFHIEYGSNDVINMIEDFYLVPVILGLDETINTRINIFDTKSVKTCNIVFQKMDD